MTPEQDDVRRGQRGFVISAELMLIAAILLVGLIAGWTKLRDQSLAEVADSMAAADTYTAGIAATLQVEGTRWINPAGVVIDPASTGPISETWNGTSGSFIEPVAGFPGVYRRKADTLTYGNTPPPSVTSIGAGENGIH